MRALRDHGTLLAPKDSRRPAQLRMLAISIALALSSVPAEAATLNFSGYVGDRPPPTDFVGYMDHAYCGLLPHRRQLADTRCARVRAWIASNIGKPRPNWTPPPLID